MMNTTMRLGASPGVNAISRAKALRADGKQEEADAVVEAYEAELVRKEQELSLREYKTKRAKALSETTQIDPEHDHEVAKAVERRKVRMLPNLASLAGIVDAAPYAAVAVQFGHLDGGPAPQGTVAPPYRLFQRQIEAAPNTVAAAQAIEAKFDARMLKIHAWEARVWNRYMWDVLVARFGLDRARDLKRTIKWIPVRRHEHFDRLANELAGTVDDANDSVSGADVADAADAAIAPAGVSEDDTTGSNESATDDDNSATVASDAETPTIVAAVAVASPEVE